MARKVFSLLPALCLCFGLAACSGKDDVPDFVRERTDEAFARYSDWKGGEKTVCFALISDVHVDQVRRTYIPHLHYDLYAAERFGCDFSINLGDIWNSSALRPGDADTILAATREEMLSYDGVCLYAPGNHDFDAGCRRHISADTLTHELQKPMLSRAGRRLHLATNCYGYYDMPRKRTRAIFLNSNATETRGGSYYTYGAQQLEWLDSTLRSTRRGWNTVVFSHYAPHPMGAWAGSPVSEDSTIAGLRNILAGYAADIDGSWPRGGEGSQRRGSSARGDGGLVGLFCGDSHWSAYTREDGVNYYITQGMGGSPESARNELSRVVPTDFGSEMLLDIVAFKPATREVGIFRIGRDAAAQDCFFNY
ncbi:MAG: hypothetical protein KBS55_03190 [Bacteroidales bacterium]|nr:hypothetical protein [Candidatus Cryptobacteroides aphodequi]